jgi:hypothetical protein
MAKASVEIRVSALATVLKPAVNGFPKIEGNFRPAPPKRAKNEVDRSQARNHVRSEEKMTDEERHEPD